MPTTMPAMPPTPIPFDEGDLEKEPLLSTPVFADTESNFGPVEDRADELGPADASEISPVDGRAAC